MKKILVLFLLVGSVFALVACGEDENFKDSQEWKDMNSKVTDSESKLTASEAEVAKLKTDLAKAISDLNAAVARVTELENSGATDEELAALQATITQLNADIADLTSDIADLVATNEDLASQITGGMKVSNGEYMPGIHSGSYSRNLDFANITFNSMIPVNKNGFIEEDAIYNDQTVIFTSPNPATAYEVIGFTLEKAMMGRDYTVTDRTDHVYVDVDEDGTINAGDTITFPVRIVRNVLEANQPIVLTSATEGTTEISNRFGTKVYNIVGLNIETKYLGNEFAFSLNAYDKYLEEITKYATALEKMAIKIEKVEIDNAQTTLDTIQADLDKKIDAANQLIVDIMAQINLLNSTYTDVFVTGSEITYTKTDDVKYSYTIDDVTETANIDHLEIANLDAWVTTVDNLSSGKGNFTTFKSDMENKVNAYNTTYTKNIALNAYKLLNNRATVEAELPNLSGQEAIDLKEILDIDKKYSDFKELETLWLQYANVRMDLTTTNTAGHEYKFEFQTSTWTNPIGKVLEYKNRLQVQVDSKQENLDMAAIYRNLKTYVEDTIKPALDEIDASMYEAAARDNALAGKMLVDGQLLMLDETGSEKFETGVYVVSVGDDYKMLQMVMFSNSSMY